MYSPSLGKLFGIEIELHWSFVFFAFFLVFSLAIFEPERFPGMVMFFVLLFVSVFLHELSHSVVSIARGINVRKIVLLPIGGIAFQEKLPEKPADELIIAIAGPGFNFLVVFLILLFTSIFAFYLPVPETPDEYETALITNPLFALLHVNILLGAFNFFLPALPLDGGRILRSILSFKLGVLKATDIVTKLSLFVSLTLFLAGFFLGNFFLPIIALFIFFGSKEEQRIIEFREALRDINVLSLLEEPIVFEPSMTVREALEELYYSGRHACIVDFGNAYGVFELSMASQENLNLELAKVAKPVKALSITTPGSRLFEAFATQGVSLLPVVSDGFLVGAVSLPKLELIYAFRKLFSNKR